MKYATTNLGYQARENKAVHESPLVVEAMLKAVKRLKAPAAKQKTSATDLPALKTEVFVPWSDFVFSKRNGVTYLPPSYAKGIEKWSAFYRSLSPDLQALLPMTDQGVKLELELHRTPNTSPCPEAGGCQAGLRTAINGWFESPLSRLEGTIRHELVHLYQFLGLALVGLSQDRAQSSWLFFDAQHADPEKISRLYPAFLAYFPKPPLSTEQAGLFPQDRRLPVESLAVGTQNFELVLALQTRFGDILLTKPKTRVCMGLVDGPCDVRLGDSKGLPTRFREKVKDATFVIERIGTGLRSAVKISSLDANDVVLAEHSIPLDVRQEVKLKTTKNRAWKLALLLTFIRPYVSNRVEPAAHAVNVALSAVKHATREKSIRSWAPQIPYAPENLILFVLRQSQYKLTQFTEPKQRYHFLLSAFQHAVREVNRLKGTTFDERPTKEIKAEIEKAAYQQIFPKAVTGATKSWKTVETRPSDLFGTYTIKQMQFPPHLHAIAQGPQYALGPREELVEKTPKKPKKAMPVAASANPRSTRKSKFSGVLLAKKWDGADPTGWWMSEKLDGIRAYWTGSKLLTRNGNEIHAPDWFTDKLPDMALDGELLVGRGKFQKTVSTVKKKTPDEAEWKKIVFRVFDAPDVPGGCEKRWAAMKSSIRGIKHVQAIEQVKCKGAAHLKQFHAKITKAGGEGVMLREPGSKYETKRSATLQKVKDFNDAEAKIVGYTEGTGRNKGRLGAYVAVLLGSRKKFNVGTGISDRERDDPLPIGTVITVKFQELTDDGIPRFPSLVAVRDYEN